MLSPLETGTTRGDPGAWEEPGDRSLARVPGTGGRYAAPAKPGNWLTWPSVARQGPLHLIHGGGLALLYRTGAIPAGSIQE